MSPAKQLASKNWIVFVFVRQILGDLFYCINIFIEDDAKFVPTPFPNTA